MSGYRYKLVIEFESHPFQSIGDKDIIKLFESFIVEHLKTDGIRVDEIIANEFQDHFEVIFFNEYPIMSFNVFFEKEGNSLKYLNIIDLVSAATELMYRNGFLQKLVDFINTKFEISQAVLLLDPVFDNYEILFSELKSNTGRFDIIAEYQRQE